MSFFAFKRRERSLMLRLCLNWLSGLKLCVEELLRKTLRENQPADLSVRFDEWSYFLINFIRDSPKDRECFCLRCLSRSHLDSTLALRANQRVSCSLSITLLFLYFSGQSIIFKEKRVSIFNLVLIRQYFSARGCPSVTALQSPSLIRIIRIQAVVGAF